MTEDPIMDRCSHLGHLGLLDKLSPSYRDKLGYGKWQDQLKELNFSDDDSEEFEALKLPAGWSPAELELSCHRHDTIRKSINKFKSKGQVVRSDTLD